MDQKTGIRSLYDEFSRGYGAEICLSCPDFRPNSTYKQSSTTKGGAVKVPRFRVAWAMIFVAIAALNFGALRIWSDFKRADIYNETSTWILNRSDYHNMLVDDALVTGALPMANVLVVGLLIGLRRRRSPPFLSGFEVFGATALALYVAGAIFFTEELVMPYLNLVLKPLARTIGIRPFLSTVKLLILASVAAVMLGLPQLAFALIGGFLFRGVRNRRAARPNPPPIGQ